MPRHELSLPQQFGRFLVTGAMVFVLVFWGLSQILVSSHDAHLDFLAVRMILKAGIHQSFPIWLQNVEASYLPFFFAQRPLLGCYILASTCAWLAAFLHDTKVLLKENTL
jgi:hypothetical protein